MHRGARALVGLVLAATIVTPGGSSVADVAAELCRGLTPTIVGTAGSDTLNGTDGPDVIVGLTGNDKIMGGAGDDVICGGEGADHLRGGRGDDQLYGQRDQLDFRASSGGAEWYVLIGDRLAGGPGDDHLDAGYDTSPNQVEEPDSVAFHGKHGVDVRLAASGQLGSAVGEGHDTVAGQPHLAVEGSPGPDHIWGSPYAEFIGGGGGNDVIRGLGGDDSLRDGGTKDAPDRDVLLGGRGADSLGSTYGPDVLAGGQGDDDLDARDWRVDALRGGAGLDEIYYTQAGWGCPTFDGGGGGHDLLWTLASRKITKDAVRIGFEGEINGCGVVHDIEALQLDPGWNKRWEVVGTDRAESVYVGDSIPLVAHMRGGDDRAIGSEADDFIVGGPGNDYVDGWLGTDTCRGFETVKNCESG